MRLVSWHRLQESLAFQFNVEKIILNLLVVSFLQEPHNNFILEHIFTHMKANKEERCPSHPFLCVLRPYLYPLTQDKFTLVGENLNAHTILRLLQSLSQGIFLRAFQFFLFSFLSRLSFEILYTPDNTKWSRRDARYLLHWSQLLTHLRLGKDFNT